MDSNIAYLKDQLTDLNTDWSIFQAKYAKASELLENLCMNYSENDLSTVTENKTTTTAAAATSATKATDRMENNNKSLNASDTSLKIDGIENVSYDNDENLNAVNNTINNISSEVMIYLPLKETINKLNFEIGFKQFIKSHFQEDQNNYTEQIKQFNYFRESTIRLSYYPDLDNIKRLFEYYNSLILIEKRFFYQSQCNFIYFTWYDCINGIQSTQKSIQFEKASILFNCAALYTQIAGLRQHTLNGVNSCSLTEQKVYWQAAAGCLHYLNTNFSNAPSMDMTNTILELFIEIFLCQAYEIEAKILHKNSKFKEFINFISIAKIYSYICEKFTEVSIKINSAHSIKSYLPEVWFYLIKVKALHFKALAHYFAACAITSNEIDNDYNDLELKTIFDDLHDLSKLKTKLKIPNKIDTPYTIGNYESCYHQNQLSELSQFYDYSILKKDSKKRINLARAHIRESIVFQEEAIRQHGFCRKFAKNDYLQEILHYYHDVALEKFMQYEADFESELFEVLPINSNLTDTLTIDPIEPNFQEHVSKDFFNLIGPLKIYCCEYDLSIPYTCILKKLQNQQTYGLTLKGDCPVRVSIVDLKSCAYNAGIREGDYIIAVQDQDVRWSKHAQVVEKIRSSANFVKLTLINVKPINENIQQTFTTSSNSLYNVNKQIDQNHNQNFKNKSVSCKNNNNQIKKHNTFTNSTSTIFSHNVINRTSSAITTPRGKTIAPTPASHGFFKSLRLPFSTVTIGQKLKRNASKFNIFSSFKLKNTEEVALKKNDSMKKNGILYKTI